MKLGSGIRCSCACSVAFVAAVGVIHSAAHAQEAKTLSELPTGEMAAVKGEIGEIVVTAQRRASTLLETPVSISAFDGAALANRNIEDLRDLKTLVPGMQLGDSYGTAAITIRGVGTVEVLQGADPGVAYHVDGIYLGRSHLAAAAFFDVGQVEILRGPQGVTFGRNSTGGSVNFIPNRPTDELQGSLSVGLEVDPFAYQVEAIVSGPLSQGINGRLSFQRLYNKGYSENEAAAGPRRFDDRDSYAVRGQLGFNLSENIEANVLVERYDASSTGPAHFLLGTPSGATPLGVLFGGTAPDLEKRKLFVNFGHNALEYTGATLKVVWDTGTGKLTSSTSYYDSHSDFLADFDGTQFDFTSTDLDNDADQFYQELLYTAKIGERFDLLLGVNFFTENSNQDVMVPIVLPTGTLNVLISSNIKTKSYAGFGYLTVHATDAWDVFGGLRYTYDDKSAERINNLAGQGADKANWDAFTYELGTSLELAQRTNVYLKYARGYKGGGFESSGPGVPPFNPEYNNTWEAGLKAQIFDRRVQATLSAFHSDYTDLQVNQIQGVSNTVTNAASATIKGAELEFVARPTDPLTIEVALSYLDAKFDEFTTSDAARPSLGVLNLAGNRLRNSPKHTASLGLAYELPVGDIGVITLRGRYYRQAKMFFSEFNIPIASQRAVGRGDASIDFETADGAWKANLFVTNITNREVLNDVVVISDILGSSAFGKLDTGRRVGLGITRKF